MDVDFTLRNPELRFDSKHHHRRLRASGLPRVVSSYRRQAGSQNKAGCAIMAWQLFKRRKTRCTADGI